jgi:hypothetical protein
VTVPFPSSVLTAIFVSAWGEGVNSTLARSVNSMAAGTAAEAGPEPVIGHAAREQIAGT